eukprot:TRINITY_DN55487_c0_g2_i1.p1 TRINITY_DN55487_c0_g2~~TRINITY_DN55487_c0_g2_i1.p1  ORF type:complete len:270 (+),score=15.50 TRINITY_DN55487_c0_g2_i1:61-810(+)
MAAAALLSVSPGGALALASGSVDARRFAPLSSRASLSPSPFVAHIAGRRRLECARRVSVVSPRAVDILTWDEARAAVADEGYAVVDIRDPTQHERARIAGSTHIPSFVLETATDAKTTIKRVAHQSMPGNLYGLAFTKPNPDFVSTFRAQFPSPDAKVLLVCQEGLRSLSAASDLERLGYKNVLVTPGLNKIKPGVFPKEGERELKDAGKGGFVAIQTQFSIVLGSILISAILFLKFFPEQAEVIFGNL